MPHHFNLAMACRPYWYCNYGNPLYGSRQLVFLDGVGMNAGKARIKQNAIIGQDHHFRKWDSPLLIFDVHDFLGKRKKLIADGYGNLDKPNAYGNGAIFVNDEDLIWVEP